ncbi:hypothetical protein CC86DRAFT_462100 [Ophiobolus disseminans]|uniref:Uncharacterized protein n=1 Tax=Ophiobolus disseminans TaxID=1469910 RepID=A0A6A7AL01_9PLEO|nr:hypothetical protein CC86DRAFT_462100 [Ophiobolus disseminans]
MRRRKTRQQHWGNRGNIHLVPTCTSSWLGFPRNAQIHHYNATMNVRKRANHSTSPPTEKKKRKLNRVKCDKCRTDKQNCAPTPRIWPQKCDRCLQKGFSCSAGKKVGRKSKYAEQTLGSRPTGPSRSKDDWDFDTRLRIWIFLVGYHEIISTAAERFSHLRDESVRPFIDAWDSKVHEDFTEKSPELPHSHSSRTVKLTTCAENISKKLIRMRADLLATAAAHNPDQGKLITVLSSHVSWLRFTNADHRYRSQKDDQILKELQEHRLVCSEFLWRQTRIAALRHSKHHHSFGEENVTADLDRLKSLCAQIKDETSFVITSGGLDNYLEACLQAFDVEEFYFDEAVSFQAFSGSFIGLDYCGRTPGHKCLDSLPRGHNRELYLKLFQSYVEGTNNLNKQDGLGRTLLHIACIKNWYTGVELLLQHGADPSATTVFGSFPLHYAAASGSTRLCQLLLRYKSNTTDLDIAWFTPQDYALKEGNDEIANLLYDAGQKMKTTAPRPVFDEHANKSSNYTTPAETVLELSVTAKNTMTWDHPIHSGLHTQSPNESIDILPRSDENGYMNPGQHPHFLSYPVLDPLPPQGDRLVDFTLEESLGYQRKEREVAISPSLNSSFASLSSYEVPTNQAYGLLSPPDVILDYTMPSQQVMYETVHHADALKAQHRSRSNDRLTPRNNPFAEAKFY